MILSFVKQYTFTRDSAPSHLHCLEAENMNQDAAITKHSHLSESYSSFHNVKKVRFQYRKSVAALKLAFQFLKRKNNRIENSFFAPWHLRVARHVFLFAKGFQSLILMLTVAFEKSLAACHQLTHCNCHQGNIFSTGTSSSKIFSVAAC